MRFRELLATFTVSLAAPLTGVLWVESWSDDEAGENIVQTVAEAVPTVCQLVGSGVKNTNPDRAEVTSPNHKS